MLKKIFFTIVVLASGYAFSADVPDPNYDESLVPAYKLPDLLVSPKSGVKIKNPTDWEKFGRPETAKIFEDEIYGVRPPRPSEEKFELLESAEVFGGIGTRKQFRATLSDRGGSVSFDILLFVPKFDGSKKFPAFAGLNFQGNDATSFDEAIRQNPLKRRRGVAARRWPYEEILRRGYAIATFCYHDIQPDKAKLFPEAGALKIFADENITLNCGGIALWSWGLSRLADFLESQKEIDSSKIVFVGHSRLGKTSLLAGAFDKRAAIVITNNSGCMGSALSRRCFGETLALMHKPVPHWLRFSAAKFNNNENSLPIDQHQLMALVAPRPLYVTSASEDLWADPRGELTSLVEASKIYKVYGAKNLPTMRDFKVESPFHGDVGYHIRKGKHDVLIYDWENWMNFTDKFFFPTSKK